MGKTSSQSSRWWPRSLSSELNLIHTQAKYNSPGWKGPGTRANICQKAWGSLVTSSQNLTSISQLKESKASIIWQALPTMAGHWFKSIWKKCASPWFILTSCITVISQRPPIQRFICWAAGSYDLRWQGLNHTALLCVSVWSTYYTLSCFFTTSPEALVVGGPGWLFCVLNPHHQNHEKWSTQKLLWKSLRHYLFHTSSLHLHFVWKCTGTPSLNKNKATCPDWLLCFWVINVRISGSQIARRQRVCWKPATNWKLDLPASSTIWWMVQDIQLMRPVPDRFAFWIAFEFQKCKKLSLLRILICIFQHSPVHSFFLALSTHDFIRSPYTFWLCAPRNCLNSQSEHF